MYHAGRDECQWGWGPSWTDQQSQLVWLKVMGGKPNPLSWLVLGGWKPVTILQLLTSLGGMGGGITGSFPNFLYNLSFVGGNCDLTFLAGEKRWLETVGCHEWGHSFSRACEGIMRKLPPKGEKPWAWGGMKGCDAAESSPQIMVSSLHLSVGLKMESRSETAKRFTESLPPLCLGSTIWNDVEGKAMESEKASCLRGRWSPDHGTEAD